MKDNEHDRPPKTVSEIGIHIGYIRDDLAEIKKSLRDSPGRAEFDKLEKRVQAIEQLIDKSQNRIVWGVVLTLITMVLAAFGIRYVGI